MFKIIKLANDYWWQWIGLENKSKNWADLDNFCNFDSHCNFWRW
jgi:hypothetical protein